MLGDRRPRGWGLPRGQAAQRVEASIPAVDTPGEADHRSTTMSQQTTLEAPPRQRPGRPRRLAVAVVAAAVAVLLSLTVTADAANTPATGTGLTAAGPVSALTGFPSWYEDSDGTRIEQCLDHTNPLCGFLPGDVPDETIPISFPDNFPEEFFYQLIGAELDFPGGGRAVLTSGLEAAFANGGPVPGDQMVFSRVRVVVRGAPVPAGSAGETLTFQHPFGTATVEVDANGDGRYVQDIGVTPGDFTTAMKGNFGPFLRWTPDPALPAGYVGNPDVPHAVTGGTNGNSFSTVAGGTTYTTDQFTISGKIATNTGVQADAAIVRSNPDGTRFVDVYATTRGTNLQVTGVDGVLPTTPMLTAGERHYARIPLTGAAPATVTVVNNGDDPVSSSQIAVTDFAVTNATYDGTTLRVAASGGSGLAVTGYGDLAADGTGSFTTAVPPLIVEVTSASGATVSHPVTVTGGSATPTAPTAPPGEVTQCPDPEAVLVDGVCTTPETGGGTTTPPAVLSASATVAQADVVRGGSTTLDASGSTGATTYAWTQLGGPPVTISDPAAAEPTVSVPLAVPGTPSTLAAPAPPTAGGPALLQLTVGDGTSTATAQVTVTVVQDDLAITATRHVAGKELRIVGTSLYGGQPQILSPQTWVYVWDISTAGSRTFLGRAQVDTLGNWELRQRPGPGSRVTRVEVQSSRGGYLPGTAVATR